MIVNSKSCYRPKINISDFLDGNFYVGKHDGDLKKMVVNNNSYIQFEINDARVTGNFVMLIENYANPCNS